MIKKLILLILSAIFFCSCSAPAPASDPSRGEQYDFGWVEAPGSVDPFPETSVCGNPADPVGDAEPVSSAEYFLFSTTSNMQLLFCRHRGYPLKYKHGEDDCFLWRWLWF